MHVVRPDPERENMNNLTRRRWFTPALTAIAGLLLGIGLTLAVTGGPSQTATSPAPSVAPTKVVYLCKPDIPVGDKRCAPETAIQLVAGSKGDEYDTRYECTPGYQSVDAPVGRVVSRFGTNFDLKSTSSYSYQESVKVTVTIAKGTEVGGTIITTAAHDQRPDLYPQYKLDVVVTDGKAEFTLQSSAYVRNYYEAGITHLTFCLRQV